MQPPFLYFFSFERIIFGGNTIPTHSSVPTPFDSERIKFGVPNLEDGEKLEDLFHFTVHPPQIIFCSSKNVDIFIFYKIGK